METFEHELAGQSATIHQASIKFRVQRGQGRVCTMKNGCNIPFPIKNHAGIERRDLGTTIVLFGNVAVSEQVGTTFTPDAFAIAIECLPRRTSFTSATLLTKFITHNLSVSLIDIFDVLSIGSLKCSLRKAVL